MIICFFSDAHGNLDSFKEFIRQTEKQRIDLFVFGGDVLGYYYESDEIIDMLKTKQDTICLLGNHDKMFLDALDGKIEFEYLVHKYGNSYLNIKNRIKRENVLFLRSLFPSYSLKIDGLSLGFFHGGPNDPLNMRIYPDTVISDNMCFDEYDYVFCGHTHHKMEKKVNNCTIINPGSIGQQRDGKGCSYILFNTKRKFFNNYIVHYDVNSLIQKIHNNETDEFMRAKLIEVLLRKR